MLHIYREVVKSIQLMHLNNITHYDIKADNILLIMKDEEVKIALADFGECKIFTSEEDEYCLKTRGTEYIKSPEMLTLSINCKKEGDKYDRRKKVGTSRSSDIWSLGCLFYEILTGDLLFFHKEWVNFYMK